MDYRSRKQRYGSPRKPRQYKKPKTPPEPSKPCVVRFVPLDKLMDYREDRKQLFMNGDGGYHEFPSKNKAQKAVWHTVQKSQGAGFYQDYEIDEV